MREECADCRFRKNSECHRFPPQMRINGSGTGSVTDWPQVRGGEWCGEWQISPSAELRQRESDELAKIGPTVEVANLARLVLENGWGDIIKADSHEPEDHRFANRHMLEFMGRNGLFRAVVHATQPLGAIQITPKGMWVRAAVERLEKARA